MFQHGAELYSFVMLPVDSVRGVFLLFMYRFCGSDFYFDQPRVSLWLKFCGGVNAPSTECMIACLSMYCTGFCSDEALLRALLSKHPEMDPKFVNTGTEGSLRTLQGTLALCISKHLNVQPSKDLLDDIVQVFVNSGWRHTDSKLAPEKV